MGDYENQRNYKNQGGLVGSREPQNCGESQEPGEPQEHGGLREPEELQKPRAVSRIKGAKNSWGTTRTRRNIKSRGIMRTRGTPWSWDPLDPKIMGDYENKGNYRNQGGQVGSSEQTNHGDNEKQENRPLGPRGSQDHGRLQEPGEAQDHGEPWGPKGLYETRKLQVSQDLKEPGWHRGLVESPLLRKYFLNLRF